MRSIRRLGVYMNTGVTVEIVRQAGPGGDAACLAAIDRAFSWFADVESRCSRYDPQSELRRLCARAGEPVPASPLLLQAVRFALAVAERSGGAFDPTVGARGEALGWDVNYRTGKSTPSGLPADQGVSWRDVRVDDPTGTITLTRPLLLDLGAVAKGLAADLAANELRGFDGFAINAGGDMVVRGANPHGEPWRLGIRHPRNPEAVCAVLQLTDAALCTSGDYERRAAPGADVRSHLLDPRSGGGADGVASCTVIAPNAILADALATAASVLGPERAIPWLEEQGVQGVLYTPALQSHATSGFARYQQECR